MLSKYILLGEDIQFSLKRPKPREVVRDPATAAQSCPVEAEVAEFCGRWAEYEHTIALPQHRELDSYFKFFLWLILRLDGRQNQQACE